MGGRGYWRGEERGLFIEGLFREGSLGRLRYDKRCYNLRQV